MVILTRRRARKGGVQRRSEEVFFSSARSVFQVRVIYSRPSVGTVLRLLVSLRYRGLTEARLSCLKPWLREPVVLGVVHVMITVRREVVQ